jgi:uncharacterized repeat protein (TIGR03803 family)
MTGGKQDRRWIFGIDFWLTIAAYVLALLMIILATQLHGQTLTVLHTFTGGADGAVPGGAGLAIDRVGNLYGGTDYGGHGGCYAGGCGVVYKLIHKNDGWIFNTLYEFRGSDGASPDAPLAFGPDGALYGTTFYGGPDDIGVLYKLQPPATVCKSSLCAWRETIVHSFTGADDGSQPAFGALSFDAAGNIYGTAAYGGADRYGTVFEVSPSSGQWLFKTLWTFTGYSDGGSPWSGVIFDAAGNLYGTTTEGSEYERRHSL